MSDVRVLTVRQPWASLIALGVKTIETRPMPTKYRGWVAIHAAAADTDRTILDPAIAPAWDRLGDFIGGNAPVRGAVVAVARLIDCLPVVENPGDLYAVGGEGPCIIREGPSTLTYSCGDIEDDDVADLDDQLLYGDFTPGRYGWLLTDVRPLATPIPWKGALGLRHAPPELIEQLPITDPTPVEAQA